MRKSAQTELVPLHLVFNPQWAHQHNIDPQQYDAWNESIPSYLVRISDELMDEQLTSFNIQNGFVYSRRSSDPIRGIYDWLVRMKVIPNPRNLPGNAVIYFLRQSADAHAVLSDKIAQTIRSVKVPNKFTHEPEPSWSTPTEQQSTSTEQQHAPAEVARRVEAFKAVYQGTLPIMPQPYLNSSISEELDKDLTLRYPNGWPAWKEKMASSSSNNQYALTLPEEALEKLVQISRPEYHSYGEAYQNLTKLDVQTLQNAGIISPEYPASSTYLTVFNATSTKMQSGTEEKIKTAFSTYINENITRMISPKNVLGLTGMRLIQHPIVRDWLTNYVAPKYGKRAVTKFSAITPLALVVIPEKSKKLVFPLLNETTLDVGRNISFQGVTFKLQHFNNTVTQNSEALWDSILAILREIYGITKLTSMPGEVVLVSEELVHAEMVLVHEATHVADYFELLGRTNDDLNRQTGHRHELSYRMQRDATYIRKNILTEAQIPDANERAQLSKALAGVVTYMQTPMEMLAFTDSVQYLKMKGYSPKDIYNIFRSRYRGYPAGKLLVTLFPDIFKAILETTSNSFDYDIKRYNPMKKSPEDMKRLPKQSQIQTRTPSSGGRPPAPPEDFPPPEHWWDNSDFHDEEEEEGGTRNPYKAIWNEQTREFLIFRDGLKYKPEPVVTLHEVADILRAGKFLETENHLAKRITDSYAIFEREIAELFWDIEAEEMNKTLGVRPPGERDVLENFWDKVKSSPKVQSILRRIKNRLGLS